MTVLRVHLKRVKANRIASWRLAHQNLTPDDIYAITLAMTDDVNKAETARSKALLDESRKE